MSSATRRAQPPRERARRLIIVAWDNASTAAAIRLTLPTLAAAGGIRALESRTGGAIGITICCCATDRPVFERAPVITALAEPRALTWLCIDGFAAAADGAEAIVSLAFRHAMARDLEAGDTAFLIKAGHILADTALATADAALGGDITAVALPVPIVSLKAILHAVDEGGYCDASALAHLCCVDPIARASSLCGFRRLWGRGAADRLVIEDGDGCMLLAARWHLFATVVPATLDPFRQSFVDAEIVPEFADEADHVARLATAGEALVAEARPRAWLMRSLDAEDLTASEVLDRMGEWATPWHRRNLAWPVRLSAIPATADAADAEAVAELSARRAEAAAVPAAVRNPLWLRSRSLRQLSPALQAERRYEAHLDQHYRRSRLMLESMVTHDVIYAGYAAHVFAGFLVRSFRRAYVASLHRICDAHEAVADPAVDTLYVINLDRTQFVTLILEASRNLLADIVAAGRSVLLVVEIPDSQGGMPSLDQSRLRDWCSDTVAAVREQGGRIEIETTQIQFFHGHPGFAVAARPAAGARQVPLPAMVAQTLQA